MKINQRLAWWRGMIVFTMLAAPALLVSARTMSAATPCCFANDRYEGTCQVAPGKEETCQSVLEYLNNPMSTGKAYCGGTSVRGGWVQVDCKSGKPIGGQGVSQTIPKGPEKAFSTESGIKSVAEGIDFRPFAKD
jgi:hypothetical protein